MTAKARRLLIIDDDHGIRHSLARIFRGIGLVVELAADGESAVRIAQRFEPDCVLADVHLPGIDGPTTCRLIREQLPSVDTIFMTAYAASQNMRTAMQVADAPQTSDSSVAAESARRCPPGWHSKPLDIEQLIRQVESLQAGGACE